jgi:acyl dehydratase
MPELRVRFEDLSVGYGIPKLARSVTREDVERYADASGDRNPLHLDDGFARSVGFPGVIAHGMFTMGHLAHCLTDWLGDPSALSRMDVQLRAPVFLGDVIVADGRVKALDPKTRTVVLDVWVTVDRDGTVEYPIRRGEAEVRLSAE